MDIAAELAKIPGRRLDHAFFDTVSVSSSRLAQTELFRVSQDGPFVLCALGVRLVGLSIEEELRCLDSLSVEVADFGTCRILGPFPARLASMFRYREETGADVDQLLQVEIAQGAAEDRYALPGYRFQEPCILSPNTVFALGVRGRKDAQAPPADLVILAALGYRIVNM